MPHPFLTKAPHEDSYSTQPQAVETIVSRTSASQYLVLDSRNRYQTATPGQTKNQPWNNFTLQRAQSLMESFATRITISEIRFPWFIPNITVLNNTLWYTYVNSLGQDSTQPITLLTGFTNPDEIAGELTNKLSLLPLVQNPPVITYLDGQYSITNFAIGVPQKFSFIDPVSIDVNKKDQYEYQFNTQPSLMATIGMTFEQSWNGNFFTGIRTGNITESLYTQYVDIISNKINQYTTNLDGSSDPSGGNRILCRIYYSDENSSLNGYNNPVNNLYEPFLIHRQFTNPKQVMWNKESVIDWLDISVRDQYNQLVALPQINTGAVSSFGAYPDFQITLLATES